MVNQGTKTEQGRFKIELIPVRRRTGIHSRGYSILARRRRWRLRWCVRWRFWITASVLAWLSFAIFVLYAAVSRENVKLPALFAIYLLLTVGSSLAAFVLIGLDKRRAAKEQPRISERTLHVLAAVGGWPGGYLARRIFRHKTLKLSFRAVAWAIIAVHALIIVYGLWSGWFWLGLSLLLGWT